jgi:hypothetical protein
VLFLTLLPVHCTVFERRGTKDLSNINLGSYYLSFSCANSSYSIAGSGTNYSTSYSLNTIPTLPIGASIQCQASYTIQQHDIEARQPVQLGVWGVCSDLPWGQQIVQATPVYVDVMWDPRVTVDIVAGNCTHSRERTEAWQSRKGGWLPYAVHVAQHASAKQSCAYNRCIPYAWQCQC